MPFDFTPKLKKREPFKTGNPELDELLIIYSDQAIEMADAEQAGLIEPVFESPPLPTYVGWIK